MYGVNLIYVCGYKIQKLATGYIIVVFNKVVSLNTCMTQYVI